MDSDRSDRRSIKSDREKHFDKDELRSRKHSPPLSSNRSRHSSLSNRSNHEFELNDHDLNRKKSGSRLSFADEILDQKHKHTSENPLRNMLKSELNHARSTESLRDNHEQGKGQERGRERDNSRSRKIRKIIINFPISKLIVSFLKTIKIKSLYHQHKFLK